MAFRVMAVQSKVMPQSELRLGRYRFAWSENRRPLVMGVLNLTPDSFSDGGRFQHPAAAISHAERMIADGVDIIDVGGESSRPGAQPLPIEEELRRIMPVLRALRDCGKPLSVDTCKPEVMRAAIDAGADMINDINGFRVHDALPAIKESDCGLCIMHMQGEPGTMQVDPRYEDVVAEVTTFLRQRVDEFMQADIARERLCVDPGFGFGKTLEHNLVLLSRLGDIGHALELPVLAGLSRKSTIGAITGRPVEERLAGSIAAALAAVARGANIIRAHDVAETVDALKVWQAVFSTGNQ